MALEIPQEPNDLLLVKLLKIRYVTVYYNNIARDLSAGNGISPTEATVFLAEPPGGVKLPDDREAEAAREWLAEKLNMDINDVGAESA